MMELIRDTAFGHLIRFVTKKKCLQYPEEKDLSIWTKYIDGKKSANLAHHGDRNPLEDGTDLGEGTGGVRPREHGALEPPPNARHGSTSSSDSSRTRVSDENFNHASGGKFDPEKGQDYHLVTWYGDDDPGMSLNLPVGHFPFNVPYRKPRQLVKVQEVLRHVRDLPAYHLGLHWK